MEDIIITKKDKNKGRLMMLITALLWGLAGVCVKSISWGSMPLIAARSILSLTMLLLFRKKARLKFTLPNIFGAVAMTATGMLYLESIKLTTAGTAIVLQYIAPILVFLYAVIFQKRKATLGEILITVAVFGGIVLSFADALFATEISTKALIGDLLGLLSGVTFAAQIIIMNRPGTDSEDSLIISNGISFIIALPFLFLDPSVSWDLTNIIWVAILGVFQYGLANVIFGKYIQKVDKIEGSLILTIEPIFNPIPVAIINHEMMGPLALIGSAVVIVFVTLYGLLPTIREKRAASKQI